MSALIHTPDSADGDWLHVVRLRRVKDAEWICLQPGASLVTWNLATHRIIALLRRAPFPEAVRGYVHHASFWNNLETNMFFIGFGNRCGDFGETLAIPQNM